jgi:hypothetical protein
MDNKSVYKDMQNSEKAVADYLQELGIWWNFEQPVYVSDEKERPRVWTPDFYLPELGIYIEVCGSKDFDYEYREEIYKKNRLPVIFIHKYKTKSEWQRFLRKSIEEMHSKRWRIVSKLRF